MKHRIFLRFASAVLAFLFAFSGVVPAFAAPPSNDNLDSATVIFSVPFSDSVDNSEATIEPNEQQWCNFSDYTVWYSFTPIVDIVVKADMEGSSFNNRVFTVYQQTGSGMGGLSAVSCASYNPIIFTAMAGVTYYIQAGSASGLGGELHLNLQQVPPPANDNFADAMPISSLPFDDSSDASAATTEAGEPTSCTLYGSVENTVWYSFTPAATKSYTFSMPQFTFSPFMAVYTGSSLNNLSPLACETFTSVLTFSAVSGTTYFIQVGRQYQWQMAGPFQVHLDLTPPPVAGLYYNPSNPSAYDVISFYDQSGDQGNAGFQSFTWEFGDGTTSSMQSPQHQYAKDGDYTVLHGVTTVDGRSATTSQVVHVRTHDVAITKISAPLSASVGQTRTITVSINNKRYPDRVQVELFKSVPGGFQSIGSYIQDVPIRSANRTTNFTFNYTFTSSDTSVGKVTFKAVARILDTNDAFPADNELSSSPPTKVTR